MKQLQLILGTVVFFTFGACAGPISHSKTETFKVAGNCDKCKTTIEAAAGKKGTVEAEWNKDTKLLKLTYDVQKTTSDEILKRVAYAGYDNEKFLAPDDAYARLEACCQYARLKKEAVVGTEPSKEPANDTIREPEAAKSPLAAVYAAYFATKDALVKDDGAAAAVQANALVKAIRGVDMSTLSADERTAWTNIEKALLTHAGNIGETSDIERQREHFAALSKSFYTIVKVLKADQTIYYQHCPMYNGGADWLSQENAVKNPYYGSSMLTCGKTTETIK